MKIQMPTWTVDVPVGWCAVIDDDHSNLRLIFESRPVHVEDRATVEFDAADLLFRRVVLPAGASLEGYAEATMKRHVEGEPERSMRRLGGREARAYEWTDGIHDLETLFVVDAAPVVLRIDLCSAGAVTLRPRYETGRRGRSAAQAILASFTWLSPQA
jgi:hypothetical protein